MQVVINKRGATLKVKDGRFCVYAGGEQQLLPMNKVRSFILSRSCMISSEAVACAVEREIDIIFVERSGKPYARVWSPRYGSIATIRKNQTAFCQSQEGVKWIKGLLAEKLDNQNALLLSLQYTPHCDEKILLTAIEKIEGFRQKILALQGSRVEDIAGALRGLEGNASRLYFDCISRQLPEPYRFNSRSQHPAMDMFNYLLNYAYGILYQQLEGCCIKAGIDPYIGVLHRDEYNKPVLVYDMIEKYRVWADYPVVNLCLQGVVFPDQFDIEAGTYWLNPAGRQLIIQHYNDYMDELVTQQRLSRSRATHLKLWVDETATLFKNHKP